MSRTLHVDLKERGYDIRVGPEMPLLPLLQTLRSRSALIVSDSHVNPLYGQTCQTEIEKAGISCTRAVIEAGETSKSLETAASLYREAANAGLDRASVIIALGGGVVGDLAGFVAATYLRGIACIQIPTSLLAMVDSSVGGKTGINLPQGKNLVGAFHQPVGVLADIRTLATLPEREYRSGLAEIVKHGIIWDATYFEQLENGIEAIRKRDTAFLEDIVARSCEIKAQIVAVDERESGVRSILNFGHTLGHAIETNAGYGNLLHGEAVSLGMVYATALSVREKGLPPDSYARIVNLLEAVGLPTRFQGTVTQNDWPRIRAVMDSDKKTRAKIPRFVVIDNIGSVLYGHEVPENVLQEQFLELTH